MVAGILSLPILCGTNCRASCYICQRTETVEVSDQRELFYSAIWILRNHRENPELVTGKEIMKKHNPHLKAAFLETVDNQLADNDPPETKETLDRLITQGLSEEDAKIYIAQAVSVEVFDIMKHQKEFNQDRYLKNLKRLPDEPEL